MIFQRKAIIIDARGHLLGRLASIVAKTLLQGQKFCVLSRLSHEVGWKYQNVIEKMEGRRKAKAAVWYKKKKVDAVPDQAARGQAKAAIAPYKAILKKYGY
ncbi:60S ribosomal protein L13A [Sparganum proliferum]